MAQRAAGLGGGGVHLLLRGGQNARAFLSNRCFDARLVREAFRLHLGTNPGNLPVQAGELGLDSAQPGVGLLGRLAGGLDVAAHLLRASAKKLWQPAEKRNSDAKDDDGEVESLEDVSRCIQAQIERLRRPLDHRAFEPEDVVLFFLGLLFRLGGFRSGLIGRLRRSLRIAHRLGSLSSQPRGRVRYPDSKRQQQQNAEKLTGTRRMRHGISQQELPAATGSTARTT